MKNIYRSYPSCSLFQSNGFSLIQLMVTVSIMSIVSLGVASLMTQMHKLRAKEGHLSRLEEVKRNIIAVIRDDASWSATVKLVINREMNCLRKGKDCQHILSLDPPPLIKHLVDASGRLMVDGTDQLQQTGGFTFEGLNCQGFDKLEGNNLCPLRYEVRWQPICPKDKPCFFSSIRVSGRLFYATELEADKLIFNKGNFAFQVIRAAGGSLNVAELSCVSNGGLWVNGGCQSRNGKKEDKKNLPECPPKTLSYRGHDIRLPASSVGTIHSSPPSMENEKILNTGAYKCDSGQWVTVTPPSEMSIEDLSKILKEGFGGKSF